MTTKELQDNKEAIQVALDKARDSQTAFWDSLRELENELGDVDGEVDIDSASDLEGTTVDDLIEEYATDEDEEEDE